jgi:hypothetical protein
MAKGPNKRQRTPLFQRMLKEQQQKPKKKRAKRPKGSAPYGVSTGGSEGSWPSHRSYDLRDQEQAKLTMCPECGYSGGRHSKQCSV